VSYTLYFTSSLYVPICFFAKDCKLLSTKEVILFRANCCHNSLFRSVFKRSLASFLPSSPREKVGRIRYTPIQRREGKSNDSVREDFFRISFLLYKYCKDRMKGKVLLPLRVSLVSVVFICQFIPYCPVP
jgi:hypothetical protein